MSETWDDAASELARTERLLVAVDFDGTLSPLVDEPMSARATPESAAAVAALTALPDTTVAFVSGRSLHDLREIAEHADDSPVFLAGSHGAQFWVPGVGELATETDEEGRALRDTLRDAAVAAIGDRPGVWIEPKAFGFGVHTRSASPADAAFAQETADEIVAAGAPAWRRRSGHNIVEYAYRHEGKDAAIAALRERVRATAVLFAGDDTTDEDALRSLGAGDLGIRVGAGETAASVRVRDIQELAALLSRVAEKRTSARQ